MTYLTGVAQDWFEVGLNQEDQDILQDWLSNWNLFINKLHWHFGLLDLIGEAANMLDNLYMKSGNKIFTYNVLWFKTQRVKSRNNSCIGVTQENLIEFLIQSSLPYILLLMVRANYCAPYPKWPWV